MYQETELTEKVRLCEGNRYLNPAAVGWSRQPLHDCEIRRHWPRKKKWNYWCVADHRMLFSVTLTNLDHLGLASAYFLDLKKMRFIEQDVMFPFGRGVALADTVAGDLCVTHPRMQVAMRDSGDSIRIHVECPDFGGSHLSADLAISRPDGHDTLNVVIPWNPKRFQFTSKQNALPAEGTIKIGLHEQAFQSGNSFACLDFGRGVWPYRSYWNWASCSGKSNGRTIGFNLGAGWTAGTGMTENGLILDGYLSKLHEDVVFEYQKTDRMAPWVLRTTASDRLELQFKPAFERHARHNFLVIQSEMHQMIGTFSGTFIPDSGDKVTFDGLVGWAEEHRARW